MIGTSVGPYFDVEQHDAGQSPSAPWRSMSELLDNPGVLDDRVAKLRAALAGAGGRPIDSVGVRIAASVMQLGLSARLLSPAIATASLTGQRPLIALDELWWQAELGGAFPLSTPPPREIDGLDSDKLGVVVGNDLIDGPIAALARAIGTRYRVPDRVLWGNVASALNAAVYMFGAAQPAASARAQEIVAGMRARASLAGEDAPFGPLFRRRSCCLIYRVSPGGPAGVCGDCIITG